MPNQKHDLKLLYIILITAIIFTFIYFYEFENGNNFVGEAYLRCSDSDNGINIFSKGTTSGLNPSNYRKISREDACANGGLNEYYCNGRYVYSRFFDASNGCDKCDNGVCQEVLTPPPPAAVAGFTNLAFDEEFDSQNSISPDGFGQYNWYATQFFSATEPKSHYDISNGILTVYNGNGVGATIATAGPSTNSNALYNGQAWQHGYFEARLRFDPSKASRSYLWPAFWSSSIEHAYDWTLKEWGEVDFMEAALINTGPGAYATTVHHWNPNGDNANYGNNVFTVPAGTDFNQFHTYGALWTPGRIIFYFDGQPGVSVSWQPGESFSIMDSQHIYMVLGTDGNWPMEVDWVRVWQ